MTPEAVFITCSYIFIALLVAFFAASIAGKFGFIRTALPKDRLGQIDGLRGYLAIGVLIHHFAIWQRRLEGHSWEEHPVYFLNNLGQSAVFLFFMVTGALFYSRVVKSERPPDWIAVYTSRVFRLTPAYWLAVVLVLSIALSRATGNSPLHSYLAPALRWFVYNGMPDIPGYPATGQIIAYTPWTLKYEWWFYFSLPLLYLTYRHAAGKKLLVWMLIGATLLASAVDMYLFSGKTLKFVAPFVFGMLSIEVAGNAYLRSRLTTRCFAGIGLLALLAELFLFPHSTGFSQYFLLAIFFTPVVCGNNYFGMLERPASIGLGEISYSIYLLHGIVLSLFMIEIRDIFHLSGSKGVGWEMFPPLALAVVVASVLSNGLVERPGIRLGRQVARSLRNRIARNPA